jgi:hypothetical protein
MKNIIIKCGICDRYLNKKNRGYYSIVEKPELINIIRTYMKNNNFQSGFYADRTCISRARRYADSINQLNQKNTANDSRNSTTTTTTNK